MSKACDVFFARSAKNEYRRTVAIIPAMLDLTFTDGVTTEYRAEECAMYFGLIANALNDAPADNMSLAVTSAEFGELIAACRRCDGPINSKCADYMLCEFPKYGSPARHFAETNNVELLRLAIPREVRFIELICFAAIRSGSYECFKLAYRVHRRQDYDKGDMLTHAAAKQRPEFAELLYKHGATFDGKLIVAVQAKQYETLKFLMTVDAQSPVSAFSAAVECDDEVAAAILLPKVNVLHAVNYFRNDSVKCFTLVYDRLTLLDCCREAASWGSAKCLRAAHERGSIITAKTLQNSACYIECLKYTWSVCHEMAPRICETALFRGDLDVLEFAYERGAKLSSHLYRIAAKFGNLAIIEWLFNHGCPLSHQDYAYITADQFHSLRPVVRRLFGDLTAATNITDEC